MRKQWTKMLKKINFLKGKMSDLTDQQLAAKTEEFKERLKKGEKTDALLPEAFAVVREAAKRVTDMEPFDVQVIGAIALHEGKIAEMKTGEGKTLVAVLPSYLHALEGKGVHVVTVNDYLAKRDAESMGKIHEFLGLTVGCVLQNSTADQKRDAYACDITYVTNSELAFDYLRDNMVTDKRNIMQRGLEYAIIDEADSILIDEARTPLIISGQGRDASKLYVACDQLVKMMEKGSVDKEFSKIDALSGDPQKETGDFVVNEKFKYVTLTPDGIKKTEDYFGIACYADLENVAISHAMEQALAANYLMVRDKDYIVRDNEILIVDEFTGRVMDGREYTDGLHQAIQAKEGVEIKAESRTVASVTYQNFFNKYKKKAGMTGTAYTQKKEFKATYNMDVVVIPTNKPVIRNDRPDVVYLTKEGKYRGIVDEVRKTHETGQPVLVGTASVKASEELSELLKEEGIAHRVLNAKQDAKEAEVIAEAGKHGAVTIATNMAGRGTDILLDEEAKKRGGLKVIGTERHESRRIDNQLRGRTGRQGDSGESVFYLSLEDHVLRLFARPAALKRLSRLGNGMDEEPLSHRMLTGAVNRAQKNVEENHYGTRKDVLDYDIVNNYQREMVYAERKQLLDDAKGFDIMKSVRICVETMYAQCRMAKEFLFGMENLIPGIIVEIGKSESFPRTKKGVIQETMRAAGILYKKKCEEFGSAASVAEISRQIFLSYVDGGWTKQLADLDMLKENVVYLGYAQKDPKSVYAIEAFRLYREMKERIHFNAVWQVYHIKPIYSTGTATHTTSDKKGETADYGKENGK